MLLPCLPDQAAHPTRCTSTQSLEAQPTRQFHSEELLFEWAPSRLGIDHLHPPRAGSYACAIDVAGLKEWLGHLPLILGSQAWMLALQV